MGSTIRVLQALGIGLVAAVALTACAAEGPQSVASGGEGSQPLRLVTTTTQVNDFTTRLSDGADIEITTLLGPGESVHSFEATPAELAAIGQADAVVLSGHGLETWLDAALDAAGFSGTTIDASAGLELPAASAEDEHASAEPEHSHAEDEHAEDEHAEDEHDDHDHGDVDPHVWTSPANAEVLVRTIADGLAALDPSDAELFQRNADSYLALLGQLDGWISENVEQVPAAERLLVSNHDALGYYNEAYGITFVGSILPSWDDNAEPSAAELDALIRDIRATGVKAIFTETQLPAQTAERLAAETGITVYSGDQALYTDALGAEGTAEATYIGATVHNTRVILESWGVTPSELPTELQGA